MFASIHTPGPATGRGRSMSPARRARGAMTEGRPKLGEGKVGEGKRIFESLAKQGATPARGRQGFLGAKDRTNQSPMRGGSRQGDDEASGSGSGGGKEANGSPAKQQQAAPSPVKTGKGKARSISPRKGAAQMQMQTPAPARHADVSYATPRSVLAEPAVPFAQRAAELKTPVAQLGRAGAARARMGELMDQAAAASAGGRVREAPEEEVEEGVKEWDEWPEIEYMAPSHWAKNTPYDFPPALDSLPRGAELGAMLASFRPVGVYRPRKLSLELEAETEKQALKAHIEQGLDALDGDILGFRREEREEEESWPNVTVAPQPKTRAPAAAASAVRPASATSSTRAPLVRGSMPPPAAPRAKPTTTTSSSTARVRASAAPASSASSVSRAQPATASAASRLAPTRAGSSSVAAKPAAPRAPVRSALAPVRPAAPASSRTATASAAAPAQPKVQLHPELLEVQRDELGLWVERQLDNASGDGADEGFTIEDEEI